MADGTETETEGRAEVETAKGAGERSELSKRAQAVARRAAESKATIPHIHLGRRISCRSLDPEMLGAAAISAAGRALTEVPALNSTYRDGAIERHARINIGVIVELEDGAVVPTVFDADSKSAEEIDDELRRLIARAGEGELTSPELAGGTFTVSILESGADWLAGSVSPGQAGHLGVGRPRPDGELNVTLSCDQRAVRAPAAAAFLELLAGGLGDAAAANS